MTPSTHKTPSTNARTWLALGVLLAVCAAASFRLWMGPGLLNTRAGGDSPFLLQRTFELAEGLRAGQFPVRWMAHGAYGLGYPFFNFYAALPYYIAAILSILGVDLLLAIKTAQTLGMIFAGMAMFSFVRQDHRPRIACLAAVAYVVAPFHLVNIYVRGDSLSEFWAFVWYPLILSGIWRVTCPSTRLRHIAGLALSVAGLVLTHNISAMLFAPVAVLAGLYRTVSQRHPQGLPRLIAAALMAAALSMWFWLPALAGAANAQLQAQTTGYFNYSQHFRGWDLLQSRLLFDYAISPEFSPFRSGLMQIVLAVAGAGAAIFAARRSDLVFFALMAAISSLLITPLSEAVWRTIGPLQLAQFPWRFLSVQAVALAWLTGQLAAGDLAWPRFRATLAGGALCLAALQGLPNTRLDIVASDITPDSLALYEWTSGNIGSTVRAEYLPAAVRPRPFTGPLLIPPAEPQALRKRTGDGFSSVWDVTGSQLGRVLVPVLYADGLTARNQNDAPLQVAADLGSGNASVNLTPDTRQVRITREPDTLPRASEAISALVLLLLLGLLARHVLSNLATLRVCLLITLTLFVALWTLRLASPTPSAPPLRTVDFARRPFPHRAPLRFFSGDAVFELTSLTFERDRLAPGERSSVSLQWANDRAPERFELQQQYPGGGLNAADSGASMFRYDTPRTVLGRAGVLEIPAQATGGPLLLRPIAQHNGALLQPISPEGESNYEPFLLGPTITHSGIISVTQPALRKLNETIDLLNFDWLDLDTQRLCFRPSWRTRAAIDAAYQVSIRMRNSAGAEVGQVDGQPQSGLFPTWAWPVNGEVKDAYCNVEKRGPIESGAHYEFEIIMYRVADGYVLGRTTVEGEKYALANATR